jgi:hypothetical protein
VIASEIEEGRVTSCEELLTPGRKDMDHCSVFSFFLNGVPHKLYLSKGAGRLLD